MDMARPNDGPATERTSNSKSRLVRLLAIGLIVLVAAGGSTLGESLARGQETQVTAVPQGAGDDQWFSGWFEHDVLRMEIYKPIDPEQVISLIEEARRF